MNSQTINPFADDLDTYINVLHKDGIGSCEDIAFRKLMKERYPDATFGPQKVRRVFTGVRLLYMLSIMHAEHQQCAGRVSLSYLGEEQGLIDIVDEGRLSESSRILDHNAIKTAIDEYVTLVETYCLDSPEELRYQEKICSKDQRSSSDISKGLHLIRAGMKGIHEATK